MRRILGLGILMATLLLIIATVLTTSAPNEASINSFAPNVLFADDFEGYEVGTFPFSGGWELWFNGVGDEYQMIVDNISASPTKSLQLWGLSGWAAFAAKRFTTDAFKIGFQVNVRVDEITGGVQDNARVSFTKWTSLSTSREYAPVVFDNNGAIVTDGKILRSYVADEWY
ncbi:hypothetical protein HXY33_06165 [Candidatus Bathyarchaeota archaeon]|nr:hypothetical protein [Candidatus Bathyarchaeota archaeon]